MEYLSSLLCQATRLAAQAHDGAYRKRRQGAPIFCT